MPLGFAAFLAQDGPEDEQQKRLREAAVAAAHNLDWRLVEYAEAIQKAGHASGYARGFSEGFKRALANWRDEIEQIEKAGPTRAILRAGEEMLP